MWVLSDGTVEKKVCGLKLHAFPIAFGIVSLALTVCAVSFDILYVSRCITANPTDTPCSLEFGWKSTRTKDDGHKTSTDNTGEFRDRGIVWLAFAIGSILATFIAIICTYLKKIGKDWNDKILAVLLAVSATFLFIGTIVAATNDFPDNPALEDPALGASVAIAFTAVGLLIIPAGVLLFC